MGLGAPGLDHWLSPATDAAPDRAVWTHPLCICLCPVSCEDPNLLVRDTRVQRQTPSTPRAQPRWVQPGPHFLLSSVLGLLRQGGLGWGRSPGKGPSRAVYPLKSGSQPPNCSSRACPFKADLKSVADLLRLPPPLLPARPR